jgi:hypothetical protein
MLKISDAKPIMPKNNRDIKMVFEFKLLATLSINAKPPAQIIRRIRIRLKEEDQNDSLLLSF